MTAPTTPEGPRPGAADPPLVEFVRVQKTYDGRQLVVRNLDLAIRRGEFLTLLGPSGSGKTTTLMMLAGFETPTAGEIRLNGHAINNLPPHRREIGMVFQNYALFPHMTVAENVGFPLSVRKAPKAELAARVAQALAMVRLDGLDSRRPSQLSGGQQQRVALARALVFQPQLVLMDEPLGALDKKLREHMQIEIKHIHQTLGVTVVYVTHDQGEALTMSDRVAVFNDGVIQQADTPAALYETPANSFVAHFIGENNILHGTVTGWHPDPGGNQPQCTVCLEGGGSVMARAINVRATGDRTSLSFRPERVEIEDAEAASATSGPPRNRLPATVRETIYFGDHLRVRLAVAGNESFMVKLRFRPDRPPPIPGSSHLVSFSAGDCLALDPVQGAPSLD